MEPHRDVLRHFHPVLPSKDLGKKPVRVLVDGRAWVLFRDGSGRPAALLDECPHRLAPLSAGRVRPDGRLQCAYHGWHFDADGHGRSPSQPGLARCDATALQVVDRYRYLWIAAKETSLDAFPSMEDAGFELGGTFSVLFRAPLHVALDNFCEDEHTPFVHTRLGWNEDHAAEIEFSADSFDDRTEVHYRALQRPSPLLRALLLRPGDFFHNDWVTRFDPVRSFYTLRWTAPDGTRRPLVTRANIFMVPETDRTTRFHVFTFARIEDPRFALLMPIVKRAATLLGWFEVKDDARFIPTVADTPLSMKRMRLGKYDKPLIHNHKLLERIYWGGAGGSGHPGLVDTDRLTRPRT